MIARTWWGATRVGDAEAYLAYLEATGLRGYRATPGNLGAYALRRDVGDRAEFLLVSFWASEDAVRAFAGPDVERAVFYAEDERFLVARDAHVTHHAVVSAHAMPGDGAGVGP